MFNSNNFWHGYYFRMITAEGAGGSLGLGLPLKIFLSIVVVGGIFSIIDDELEYLLGDLFSNSIVPLTLLVVLTLLIIFFELRILQIGMKYYKEKQQLLLEVNEENISEYGRSKVHKQKFSFTLFLFVLIKWILLIVCFVIGYSFILGSDLINFSDTLNDKSEETLGTGLFTWLFWTLLYFSSIPVEFILKLIIVPLIQIILIYCTRLIYKNLVIQKN